MATVLEARAGRLKKSGDVMLVTLTLVIVALVVLALAGFLAPWRLRCSTRAKRECHCGRAGGRRGPHGTTRAEARHHQRRVERAVGGLAPRISTSDAPRARSTSRGHACASRTCPSSSTRMDGRS